MQPLRDRRPGPASRRITRCFVHVHHAPREPDELHAMALVATGVFAHDAPMAYLLDWNAFPDRVALDTPPTLRTLDRQHRLFYYFVDGLARGTLLTGGRLVVAVVPDDAQPGKERIVAVAYWVAPRRAQWTLSARSSRRSSIVSSWATGARFCAAQA